MHPAKSVIFFTVSSGAGYGLLVCFAASLLFGILPFDPGISLRVHAIAFVLVTSGLLASTWHLGHPERAWRAISQWRTSWLSREGALALLTYLPWAIFATAGILAMNDGLVLISGLLTAVLALATVGATAMIYQSLKPIPAWSSWTTLPGYLLLSLATGGGLMFAIAALLGYIPDPLITRVAHIAAGPAILVKLIAWGRLARATPRSRAASALGLPAGTRVKVLEHPHSEANFLMKEMIYQVAREHVWLMRIAFIVLMVAGLLATGWAKYVGAGLGVAGAVAFLAAAAVERWLFFAEARHTVGMYYGEPDV